MMMAFAQTRSVTVNGTITRRPGPVVKLYTVNHGRLEELAASKPDTAGRFGFLFYPPREGFYLIGTGPESVMADKHTFYFKPGDQLQVTLGNESYALTGRNSPENQALASWYQQAAGVAQPAVYLLRGRSETFRTFFPRMDSLVTSMATWQPPKTGNRSFDAAFARRRQVDVLSWALGFMTSPNSEHPTVNDYTAYYRQIRTADYTRDGYLLSYPMGVRLVTTLPMAEDIVAGRPLSSDLTARLANVQNDTLRGEVVIQSAGGLKTYLGYLDLINSYGKYLLTDDQQRRATEIKTKLAKDASKPGQAALDFTYPDLAGKKVSLSDFKGKVVLVDVWATWCGPCKKEIPALKKLEEEMRGKEIVFMSVSVDEEKDYQKWKDFVAKEELKGVQLFASGWSEIAKNYDIKGIPRFMVFDQQGNIVSIDAPRPSSRELRIQLDALLK